MKQGRTRTRVQRGAQQNAAARARRRRVGASASSPSTELAPVGPHPRLPGRNARGRFQKDNDDALVHGANSQRRSLLLEPIRHDIRVAILSDIAHTDADVPRALSIIIDQLVEARLIAQSYFEFLASSGGPITTKGRQRRAVDGWSRASDRVAKFASMVGLERRIRRVQESPAEWLERISQGRTDGKDNETLCTTQEEKDRCGVPRIQWIPRHRGVWAASNCSGLTPPR